MAAGDWQKHHQKKVTNLKCESCGHNNWMLLEQEAGMTPYVPLLPPGGAIMAPPPHLNCVLLVCNNCMYARTYLIPASSPAQTVAGAPKPD
jgi:hypothetical protein